MKLKPRGFSPGASQKRADATAKRSKKRAEEYVNSIKDTPVRGRVDVLFKILVMTFLISHFYKDEEIIQSGYPNIPTESSQAAVCSRTRSTVPTTYLFILRGYIHQQW